MYILVENNEYVRQVNLETEYSHISFPANPTTADLPPGVVPCRQLPSTYSPTSKLTPDTPKLVDGEWVQDWKIEPLPDVEIQMLTNIEWDKVRKQRDAKILEVEWRVMRHLRELRMSMEPTEDIAVLDQYIKTLTDITEQQTDPFNIDWPEKP